MLKAAIIGCGKIADSHAASIARTKRATLVAVCDREELMARQLRERYGVPEHYTDAAELLRRARPDVVHITTPPQSHFALAKQCLDAGCHVLVEKPFTLNAPDGEVLLALADARGVTITAGHDEQFSHAALRMRELVRGGYLGGAPVHIESTWCYSLTDPVYAKALLTDAHHWVRQLPGGLLHNLISHGIAKIAEFLPDEAPDDLRVVAVGYTSPFLRALGERELVDELRVVITSGEKMSAYFTFSSQMSPGPNQLALYGPANGLLVDEDRQTVIKLPGKRHKSYLEQFVPPLMFARQHLAAWRRNVRLFLRSEFHPDAGRKHLLDALYDSIEKRTAPPLSRKEILLTARIMDAIFAQLRDRRTSSLGAETVLERVAAR